MGGQVPQNDIIKYLKKLEKNVLRKGVEVDICIKLINCMKSEFLRPYAPSLIVVKIVIFIECIK